MAIEAVIANQIIDASTVGRNALTAADAAAFRATIGADTTYLALAGGTLTGSLSLGENALTCGAITTNSTQLNVSPANNVYAEYAVAVGGRLAWRYYGGSGYGNQPLNIIATGGVNLQSTDRVINWGNASLWNGPSEGILQQRNGLNAQTYELFETYTSSTSFGSLCLKATASGHQIGSAVGSAGGSNRAIQLGHFNSAGTFTTVVSVSTTGPIRISTGVNLEFASASHYLMSDGSSLFADSSGDLWVRRSGTPNLRVNQTNATASLRGVWTRVVCLTADHTTPIAYLVPGSTDAKLRADGGLRVRDLADSADANFTAAVGTFSSIVTGTITNTGTITLPTASTTLVGRDTTDTLTNKRLQRRIVSTTSATTLTPDISAADFYEYTALAAGLTINNPTGTPVNGELLNFRLQDNGTGRAITWGAQFRSMTATLPTTTVANKTHRILCEWNSGNSTWDCLAVSAQP